MLSLLLDQPPSVGYPILLLPSIDQSIISGIGISTDYPSLTPFATYANILSCIKSTIAPALASTLIQRSPTNVSIPQLR